MRNGGGLGLELVVKALFGILIFVGFVSFGMLETKSLTSEARSMKVIIIDAEKHQVVSKSDFVNYNMSNRRVPNGPDPIHNRRAGNSGRPPGHA